ncbi:PfkB family carbohydrate kinase [Ampullimonas aquatilis]|uniref:PfkB family carbohydrate kinase n=1 Tax=Ampullimonas aquatilis TaxID=1341549 RepID=UPI003C72B877
MRVFVVGNYMNANFLQVDHLPQKGESLPARSAFQEHGGKGLNLALGLQRLGVTVDLLMVVGQDSMGTAVLAALASEGLSTQYCHQLGEQSGYGVGFIAPDGSNFLAAYLGANILLSANHVFRADKALQAAQYVIAQFEVADEPIVAAFQRAHERGIPTYLNPSPWRPIDPDILQYTDVLVVNVSEAASLFTEPAVLDWQPSDWTHGLAGLARKIGWQGQLLCITLAERGAIALDEQHDTHWVAAFEVGQLDATGAGDAFGCGLIRSILMKENLADALRYANACGAMIAARQGIFAHLPSATQVQQFLAQQAAAIKLSSFPD